MLTDAGVVADVIDRMDQLQHSVQRSTAHDLRTNSDILMQRRRAGDQSVTVVSQALAFCREAVGRSTGTWPSDAAVRAAVTAACGALGQVKADPGRPAAAAMAAYWHGLVGSGVHLMTADESRAEHLFGYLTSVLPLLGGDAAVLTQTMDSTDRRHAYAAMITVGSYSELAADYLRDNLSDATADVVQRNLAVAIVEDGDYLLGTRCLAQVAITAPRVRAISDSLAVDRAADDLQRNVGYRRDRRRQMVAFSRAGMSQIKNFAGWGAVPAATAVTFAHHVESAVLRRERLVPADESQTIADITVQGYVRVYDVLTGFLPSYSKISSGLDRIYDLQMPKVAESVWTRLFRRDRKTALIDDEIAFERVVDHQRSIIYQLRRAVRESTDAESLLQSMMIDVARTWSARGVDAVRTGLRDVLHGPFAVWQDDANLNWPESAEDLTALAVGLLGRAIERRADAMGASAMSRLVRKVLLTIIDVEWCEQLGRLRFLQRHFGALYGPTNDPRHAQRRDADILFVAVQQSIGEQAIGLIANAEA